MRSLTEAEARVVAVLLASRPDRERDRLKFISIPRSTYHAIRRRAYDEGWLRDRYVPHPAVLGRPFVSFLLARPYADRFDELLAAVGSAPGAVVVCRGGQAVLGVLFHAKPTEATKLAERLGSGGLAPPATVITVRTEGPSIPVYFDYEGLWCHVAGFDGTLGYPHGLGGGLLGDAEEPAPVSLSAHQGWAASELIRRPFSAPDDGRGGHLVGPLGLPFSQRRLLQRGWVVHRTILEPSRLPPFQGRAADQVVLVTGRPLERAQPEALFATLSQESRVYPFLFVAGADRWLLGAMGSSNPAPTEGAPARRPVLPTMREYLEGIEILQEPAGGFSATVDHRYDRLLPSPSSTPSAKV